MVQISRGSVACLLLVAVAATAVDTGERAEAQGAVTTVAELAGRTHFHGIAVDIADPARILLATHHGLPLLPALVTSSEPKSSLRHPGSHDITAR